MKYVRVEPNVIAAAIEDLIERKNAFRGPHEALGVITEEYHELIEAVKSNEVKNVSEELLDVGLAALAAYFCLTPRDGIKL